MSKEDRDEKCKSRVMKDGDKKYKRGKSTSKFLKKCLDFVLFLVMYHQTCVSPMNIYLSVSVICVYDSRTPILQLTNANMTNGNRSKK